LDDDDGKGYFYWRQLAPGIVGRARSENYPLFVLGE
jgi:hypothetical protein